MVSKNLVMAFLLLFALVGLGFHTGVTSTTALVVERKHDTMIGSDLEARLKKTNIDKIEQVQETPKEAELFDEEEKILREKADNTKNAIQDSVKIHDKDEEETDEDDVATKEEIEAIMKASEARRMRYIRKGPLMGIEEKMVISFVSQQKEYGAMVNIRKGPVRKVHWLVATDEETTR